MSVMTLPPHGETFAAVVEQLEARLPFALSRWGDGEWASLLGKSGATVDGQPYTAALRHDLTAVLQDHPRYWLGMQGFALRRMAQDIAAWLAAHHLTFDWIDADLFVRASLAGTLQPFIHALTAREVIIVGPVHLARLSLFPIAAHIGVEEHGCHATVEAIVTETREVLEAHASPVVLVSAGPAAKVLVHRLWQSDQRATLIDCGSLWEPFVGIWTRTYHRLVPVAPEVRA